MKILHVITSLHIGGAEKLLTEICPLLVQKGHEVDVLSFNGKDTFLKKTLENNGIRVLYFCKNDSYYDFRYVFKLMRIIRNYDVIHTHLTAPQLFCAIANVFHSRPLVTTEHNTTNSRRGNILYSLVDGWMYSQYQSIICISDKTEENLKTALKNRFSKLLTINNGINVEKYKIEILEDSEELQKDIKSVSEMFKDVFTDKELSKSLIWAFVLWAIFY